jgi:hypothetical protein
MNFYIIEKFFVSKFLLLIPHKLLKFSKKNNFKLRPIQQQSICVGKKIIFKFINIIAVSHIKWIIKDIKI